MLRWSLMGVNTWLGASADNNWLQGTDGRCPPQRGRSVWKDSERTCSQNTAVYRIMNWLLSTHEADCTLLDLTSSPSFPSCLPKIRNSGCMVISCKALDSQMHSLLYADDFSSELALNLVWKVFWVASWLDIFQSIVVKISLLTRKLYPSCFVPPHFHVTWEGWDRCRIWLNSCCSDSHIISWLSRDSINQFRLIHRIPYWIRSFGLTQWRWFWRWGEHSTLLAA